MNRHYYQRPAKPPPPIARVYVAAPTARRDSASAVADSLRVAGYEIGSIWHRHPGVNSTFCEVDPDDFREVMETNARYLIVSCAALVWVGSREEWGEAWEKEWLVKASERGSGIVAKRFDDDAALADGAERWSEVVAEVVLWLGEALRDQGQHGGS